MVVPASEVDNPAHPTLSGRVRPAVKLAWPAFRRAMRSLQVHHTTPAIGGELELR